MIIKGKILRGVVLALLMFSLAACQENMNPDEEGADPSATTQEQNPAGEQEQSKDSTNPEEDEAKEANQVDETLVYEPSRVSETLKHEALIGYQIFPIAYADSDGNGMGDLEGITNHLDYLKNDLNVDAIWLNPIHPSPSYHKYDVVDYYDIDLSFGNLEDYKRLIEEAHKREIKVLLDFVVNHTSSKHPWFLAAKTNPDSPYRDYYVIREDRESYTTNTGWYGLGDGSGVEYFASFWSEMPELNFENQAVRDELKKIAGFWMDLGVDGFRIDAAKHVYDIKEYPKGTPVLAKNQAWFLELNAYMKEQNKDSLLLLETWDGYSSVSNYLAAADASFNFDLSDSIISAVISENRKSLQGKLTSIYGAYDKKSDSYIDAVFLTNHDQNRIMSTLGEDPIKAKLAATIEFTLPGLTWIYYGEELGMTGEKPDENIREAFKWTDDQTALPNSRWRSWQYNQSLASLETQRLDETSMFKTYTRLTSLKANDEVIAHGTYLDYEIDKSFRVFSFFRTYENRTYLVMHNLHGEAKTFDLSESSNLVFETGGSAVEGKVVTLMPYSSVILEVTSTEVAALELGR